jgi:branched-chain amino acid transport system ATP-binding protein
VSPPGRPKGEFRSAQHEGNPVTALLQVEGLSVAYGKVPALRSVSLAVPAAAIVCVIGANGAGKSTLLNALMGLLPAAGSIRLQGVEQVDRPVAARVASGITLVPERRELFGALTVHDNLVLGGYLLADRHAVKTQLADIYRRFPRLEERRGQLAATLSGGERQMLAMGRALMSRPQLLMLDEPSLGLAPRIVAETLRIVVELQAAGVSTLLVEQNARAALQIASHGHVMELGELRYSAPAHELLNDERVMHSYLGSHAQASAQPGRARSD